MSSITKAALDSINLTPARGGAKGKVKKAKLVSEVTRAHQQGADLIEKEWQAGMDALWSQFTAESVAPSGRQIRHLNQYTEQLREECQRRLAFAESVTRTVLNGVDALLRTVQSTGVDVCRETELLDLQAPYVLPRQTSPNVGVPMAEVRGYDSILTETHKPAKYVRTTEQDEVDVIRRFFDTVLEPLQADLRAFAMPLTSPRGRPLSPPSSSFPRAASPRSGPTSSNEMVLQASAAKLSAELESLTSAMTNLLQRVKTQDAWYRERVEHQQRVLDEGATRVKLADDLLNGTLRQASVATDTAVVRARKLDQDLRSRMDALEAEVRATLEELIQGSAELCADSNAYSDQAALIGNKERTQFRFMGRMRRSAVEQAALLRDVQSAVLDLWRCNHFEGREEKATECHTALPRVYQDHLASCDHDTLVRLLHHMSLHSEDAAKRLMGALDEHNHFLEANSTEAAAMKEEEALRKAVTALLLKLKEESMVHCNPHHPGATLSDTVREMVQHYNTYMAFNDVEARAQLKMRLEAERMQARAAFFDDRTPLPEKMRVLTAAHANSGSPSGAVRCPFNPELYPPTKTTSSPKGGRGGRRGRERDGKKAGMAHSNGKADGNAVVSAAAPLSAPASLMAAASPPQVTMALQRSNPSTQHPTCSTISVVGDGRWGGRSPVVMGSLEADTVAAQVARRPGRASAVTLAMAAVKEANAAPPVPGVPPRKALAAHVLHAYGGEQHGAARAAMATSAADGSPPRAGYDGVSSEGDNFFVNDEADMVARQRAVWKRLQLCMSDGAAAYGKQ